MLKAGIALHGWPGMFMYKYRLMCVNIPGKEVESQCVSGDGWRFMDRAGARAMQI